MKTNNTQRPLEIPRIVCGIELNSVFLIFFISKIFLFVSDLFCCYKRDTKCKCHILSDVSATILAFLQQTICHFYVRLVTPNKTVHGFPAIFENVLFLFLTVLLGVLVMYQRGGLGGGGTQTVLIVVCPCIYFQFF